MEPGLYDQRGQDCFIIFSRFGEALRIIDVNIIARIGVNANVEEVRERYLVLYIYGGIGYSKSRIFLTHICLFFFENSAS